MPPRDKRCESAGGRAARRSCALSRRCAALLYMIMNRGPAQCCVWPVAVPAEAFVRAGAGLRGGVVLSKCLSSGSRRSCVSIGMVCVRSRRSCGSIGLFCARSRRSCVPVEMSCVRLMSVVRFYWDVLAFVRACHTFLSGCLMFDHACCLPPVRQTERLAICFVSVPPWVVIAIRAFSDVAWLSGFVG